MDETTMRMTILLLIVTQTKMMQTKIDWNLPMGANFLGKLKMKTKMVQMTTIEGWLLKEASPLLTTRMQMRTKMILQGSLRISLL